jgi:hypothetical protein
LIIYIFTAEQPRMLVSSVRYNFKFFYLSCSLASKVKVQQLRVACSNRFKFNGTVCPGKLPGKAEHPAGIMISRLPVHGHVPEPELEWVSASLEGARRIQVGIRAARRWSLPWRPGDSGRGTLPGHNLTWPDPGGP